MIAGWVRHFSKFDQFDSISEGLEIIKNTLPVQNFTPPQLQQLQSLRFGEMILRVFDSEIEKKINTTELHPAVQLIFDHSKVTDYVSKDLLACLMAHLTIRYHQQSLNSETKVLNVEMSKTFVKYFITNYPALKSVKDSEIKNLLVEMKEELLNLYLVHHEKDFFSQMLVNLESPHPDYEELRWEVFKKSIDKLTMLLSKTNCEGGEQFDQLVKEVHLWCSRWMPEKFYLPMTNLTIRQ